MSDTVTLPPPRVRSGRRPEEKSVWRPGRIEPAQVFRTSGVTYEQYVAISDALTGPRIFVTFDRGELQLMGHGPVHEDLKSLLTCLICGLVEATGVTLRTMGNPTLRRAARERGFEPDETFYRTVDRSSLPGLSPEQVPVPDLAVEVEYSTDVLDRLPVYAAVGVPEVWRVREDGLVFLRLASGLPEPGYREVDESELFPAVTPQLVGEAAGSLPFHTNRQLIDDAADFFRERLADRG